MAVSAEDMHGDMLGLLPAIAAETSQAGQPDLCLAAAQQQRSSATDAVKRATFLDHIDSCVRHFAAVLGAAQPEHAESMAAEHSRVQLWCWLHDDNAVLDDGKPIDFFLFDAAIQRVGERLPRRGLPGQENVLQAAWLLAELTHARALPDAGLVLALARTL